MKDNVTCGIIDEYRKAPGLFCDFKNGVINEVFKIKTTGGTLTGIITEDGFNIITEDGQTIIPE